jgi:geranylgeranyl diphosphate synthase type I
MVGALLAGQKKSVIKKLAEIGEFIGLIFQIKDDELGLFGEEKEIGKPVGSDIKEGKKTLYHLYLMQRVNDRERKKLLNIFGNKDIDKSEVKYIRDLVEKYKVDGKIDKEIGSFYKKAKGLVSGLIIEKKYKDILSQILEYNLERKR